MAGELGLQNSFRERVYEPLKRYREGQAAKNIAGRDIGLVQFMQKHAINDKNKPEGLKNTEGKAITMTDVWKDLGMDPRITALENILTLSEDIKYLAPEMVRGFIVKGINAKPWWDRLCTGTVNVPSKAVTGPWIEYKDVNLETTEEVATIAEADVEWGEKTVTLQKRAKAIKLSDEFLFGAVLPIVQPFLERVGIQMAASLNSQAVTTLVNGDGGVDGKGNPVPDSCAVIGTATGTSLQFKDFVRAWSRGSGIYFDWHTLITSEEMSNEVLAIDQFIKPQGAGSEVVTLQPVDRVLPSAMPHLTSSAMPNNQVMLVDPRLALLHLLYWPLRVESERIVMRQMQGTAVSIIQGYMTIDRMARIIVDKSSAFSSAGFPAWMTPLD